MWNVRHFRIPKTSNTETYCFFDSTTFSQFSFPLWFKLCPDAVIPVWNMNAAVILVLGISLKLLQHPECLHALHMWLLPSLFHLRSTETWHLLAMIVSHFLPQTWNLCVLFCVPSALHIMSPTCFNPLGSISWPSFSWYLATWTCHSM